MRNAYGGVLFRLRVDHGYFEDGICRSLEFRSSESTSRELRRHRWVVKPSLDGFSIHALEDSLPARLECLFLGIPRDPFFWVYTAAAARPQGHVFLYDLANLEGDGSTLVPVATTAEGYGPADPNGLVLRMVLEFDPREVPQSGEASFRIRFEPRAFLWKYHLLGEFARPDLEVHDPEGRLRFTDASLQDSSLSRSLVSHEAVAIRQIAPQKLQLRDLRTGRVLVKRLPLPDIRKLGLERLPSGETSLVAEAFINP